MNCSTWNNFARLKLLAGCPLPYDTAMRTVEDRCRQPSGLELADTGEIPQIVPRGTIWDGAEGMAADWPGQTIKGRSGGNQAG